MKCDQRQMLVRVAMLTVALGGCSEAGGETFQPEEVDVAEDSLDEVDVDSSQMAKLGEAAVVGGGSDFDAAGNAEYGIISKRGHEWTIWREKIPGVLEYWTNGQKPAGFVAVDSLTSNVYFISGEGTLFQFSRERRFSEISSNIKNWLPPEVLSSGKFSVKGFDVEGGEFFVSFSSNRAPSEEPCWSTSVLSGRLGSDGEIAFAPFWQPNVCVSALTAPELNPHQAGGGLLVSGENVIITSGEYRGRALAQDSSSGLGAVVSVRREEPEVVEVLAIGLRNPSSVVRSSVGLLISDQGPRGGDEINLIEDGLWDGIPINFGWPLVSYGLHYDGVYRSEAPLKRPHSVYGFQEPSFFFSASIGVSTIAEFGDAGFLVGGMGSPEEAVEGDVSISVMQLLESGHLEWSDQVVIGERVRDLEPSRQNCWWVVLDSAEFGEICKI